MTATTIDTMSSNELAELAGVPYRRLDYYVRLGLFGPGPMDLGTGNGRRFTADDLALAKVISAMVDFGVLGPQLNDVARFLRALPADEWVGLIYLHNGRILQTLPAAGSYTSLAVIDLALARR